jgi:hypothetical protein
MSKGIIDVQGKSYMKNNRIMPFAVAVVILLCSAHNRLLCHLCDNVFRQADKLIVKPENYNLVVKDKTEFKIFLQNNMDRGIAEIALIAESPAFDFNISPEVMSIPKGHRVFFKVSMATKQGTKTGNYPINFRLVGGGRQFKSFSLDASGAALEDINQNHNSGRIQGSAADESGALKVPRTIKKPLLDGVMNDPVWKTASVISNLSSASGGDSENQTIVLLMHDTGSLYLGIYCCDEAAKDLSKNDYVEIQISQAQSGYPGYSLTFPAAGAPSVKKHNSYGKSVNIKPFGLQYFINTDVDSWGVEAEVPLQLINIAPKGKSSKYYMRITRVKNAGRKERSYWAADSTGYNKKDGMGEFILAP